MRSLRGYVFCLVLLAAAAPVCTAQEDLSRPNSEGPPTPVQVSLYLADLHVISGADETFLADVVLQATWVDPRLAEHASGVAGRALDDVWNPRLQVANQRGITSLLPQRVEIDGTGRVRYRQRWVGRFSTRMNLKDFPRDRQRFNVQVVSLGYGRNEVDLIVNPEQPTSGRATELTITDWHVGPAQMEVADFEPAPGAKPLAGVQLRWEAGRIVEYYAVQVILPLVFIVFMGFTATWVDPSVVTARVSIAMTAMLTLIAYRFTLATTVPPLNYLTRFDYFMLGSTVLIFANLMIVAWGARLVASGQAPLVQQIDRWTRRVLPAAFAVVFALSLWG